MLRLLALGAIRFVDPICLVQLAWNVRCGRGEPLSDGHAALGIGVDLYTYAA